MSEQWEKGMLNTQLSGSFKRWLIKKLGDPVTVEVDEGFDKSKMEGFEYRGKLYVWSISNPYSKMSF